MYPWDAKWKPKPLNPKLYTEEQCLAASGELPADHPAWKLRPGDERPVYLDLQDPLDS